MDDSFMSTGSFDEDDFVVESNEPLAIDPLFPESTSIKPEVNISSLLCVDSIPKNISTRTSGVADVSFNSVSSEEDSINASSVRTKLLFDEDTPKCAPSMSTSTPSRPGHRKRKNNVRRCLTADLFDTSKVCFVLFMCFGFNINDNVSD